MVDLMLDRERIRVFDGLVHGCRGCPGGSCRKEGEPLPDRSA
jgi:hypothetical protein